RTTLANLLDLLQTDPPAHVVPGHGPALTTPEALEIATADLAYLRALRDAVVDARGDRARARAAATAVPLPRPAPDDFADLHMTHVDVQLDELLPERDHAADTTNPSCCSGSTGPMRMRATAPRGTISSSGSSSGCGTSVTKPKPGSAEIDASRCSEPSCSS